MESIEEEAAREINKEAFVSLMEEAKNKRLSGRTMRRYILNRMKKRSKQVANRKI